MEQLRLIVLKMFKISDEGRTSSVSEFELILRDKIKEALGVYSNKQKMKVVENGK